MPNASFKLYILKPLLNCPELSSHLAIRTPEPETPKDSATIVAFFQHLWRLWASMRVVLFESSQGPFRRMPYYFGTQNGIFM